MTAIQRLLQRCLTGYNGQKLYTSLTNILEAAGVECDGDRH